MRSLIKKNAVLAAALSLSFAIPTVAEAQICHNLYPSPEKATYDNGGQDLRGFIITNKKDFLFKGALVDKYSKGNWGYMQVKTARVPSVGKDQKLNYSEYIDVTLAMYKTKDSSQATWWARQCNTPKGPLVDQRIDPMGMLDMDYVRNSIVFHDIQAKQFSLIEHSDNRFNPKDYDDLVKNYIMVENGLIPAFADYTAVIDYYDNFASKFSDITDPLLEYKSFITFFNTPNAKYVGYFNVVNNKLAGRLELVNITYDRDKEMFVTSAFKKLTGTVVYIYGDDLHDLTHTINTYSREHDIKVVYRKTTTTREFNKDISVHQKK